MYVYGSSCMMVANPKNALMNQFYLEIGLRKRVPTCIFGSRFGYLRAVKTVRGAFGRVRSSAVESRAFAEWMQQQRLQRIDMYSSQPDYQLTWQNSKLKWLRSNAPQDLLGPAKSCHIIWRVLYWKGVNPMERREKDFFEIDFITQWGCLSTGYGSAQASRVLDALP